MSTHLPTPAPDRGGPAQPLIIARDLVKHFHLHGSHRGATVHALDGVSFTLSKGETLGVVGESGCGKSTLARALMHLVPPDTGELIFDGDPVAGPHGIEVSTLRQHVQMVFQDSSASLNPRLPVLQSVAFGPVVRGHGRQAAMDMAREALRLVNLDPVLTGSRYPHELSGGQKQRVNIARAIAMQPRMVILDEAVSALDKSVQADVLNLLFDLRDRLGLTYLFISHDLGVVRHISDRAMVMYLGRVMEVGPVADIFARPLHPYTQALLASRPSADPARRIEALPVSGDPPNPIDLPPGCRFAPRCRFAEPACLASVPDLEQPPIPTDVHKPDIPKTDSMHQVACIMHKPGSGHTLAPAAAA